MSFNFRSFNAARSDGPAAPDAAEAYDEFGLQASVGERVVTAVAVILAILFVSTVAVLMGMA